MVGAIPAATPRRTGLGDWDNRFDDDLAAWLASQPPAGDPPPCHDC